MNITVEIPDEGVRILESWLGAGQIQPWLQHAIDNKLRQRTDASVLEQTDKNPKKLVEADKFVALAEVVLPTRDERDGIILEAEKVAEKK